MTTVELGRLKQDIEPASLAGAAVTMEPGIIPKFFLDAGQDVREVTADILVQLDSRGVLVWVPGGKAAAAGGPLPASLGTAGTAPAEPEPPAPELPASPPGSMLDPSVPPQYTPVPEGRDVSPLLWRFLSYAVSLVAVPAGIFFAYAIFSSSVLNLQEAIAGFGGLNWALAVLAGVGVGVGVDLLSRRASAERE